VELERKEDKGKKVYNHRRSVGERRGKIKRWRKRRSKICGGARLRQLVVCRESDLKPAVLRWRYQDLKRLIWTAEVWSQAKVYLSCVVIYNYAGFIFTDKKNLKKMTHNKFFLEAPVFWTPGTGLTLSRFCLTCYWYFTVCGFSLPMPLGSIGEDCIRLYSILCNVAEQNLYQ
jgi:hypothetical protein